MRKEIIFNHNSTQKSNNLCNLPYEVLLLCFSFITSPKDLVSLSKTCHVLRVIVFDKRLLNNYAKFLPNPSIKRYDRSKIKYGYAIGGLLALPGGLIVNGIELIETTQFKLIGYMEQNYYGEALALLANNRIANADLEGGIQIWKISSFTKTQKKSVTFPRFWHRRSKSSLQYHLEKTIRLESCTHSQNISLALATLPNGNLASGTCCRGTIYIYDTNTGKCIITLEGHNKPVKALAILSDGNLVSGSGYRTSLQKSNRPYDPIRVWNVESGQCMKTLIEKSHEHANRDYSVVALAALPHNMLASARFQNDIIIWNVNSGLPIKTLSSHASKLAVLHSGHLASWNLTDDIRIWHTKTGKCMSKLQFEDSKVHLGHNVHGNRTGGLIVLADGSLVCGRSNDGFYVYKFPTFPENRLANNEQDIINEEQNAKYKFN